MFEPAIECPACQGTGHKPLKTIGDRLRAAREHLGLSLRDVEERVGISNPSISQAENGVHDLRAAKISRLAAHYGVSADWILGAAGAAIPRFARARKRNGARP